VRRDQNLTILYHSDKNSEVKVQLFNLRGQLLSERGIPANSAVDFNLPTVDKNGHALASGIYFLRLNQDNNIRNHKLIITK